MVLGIQVCTIDSTEYYPVEARSETYGMTLKFSGGAQGML